MRAPQFSRAICIRHSRFVASIRGPRPIKTKNLTAHHGSHSNSYNYSYNYSYNDSYKGMAQYINCSMDAAADRARRAPCGAYAIHTLVVALL